LSKNAFEEKSKEFQNWQKGLNERQKPVFLAAVIIGAAMVLYPPKLVSVTILGTTTTSSAGHSPIWDNAAAGDLLGMASVHVNWMYLLIQLVILAVVAFFAIQYLKANNFPWVSAPPTSTPAPAPAAAPSAPAAPAAVATPAAVVETPVAPAVVEAAPADPEPPESS
jgi:hypothetical protein